MRRRGRSWLWLGLCSLWACDKSFAGSLSPDFSGMWDVTYDDAMAIEVRVGEERLRANISDEGGPVAFRDGGTEIAFDVDCARPELVCPSEVWPRELPLKGVPGRLDDEGVQLARPLTSQGRGACQARPGSMLTGEVMSTRSSDSVRSQAVAVSSGRMTIIVDRSCFAPDAELPPGAEVALSIGYTAAKR